MVTTLERDVAGAAPYNPPIGVESERATRIRSARASGGRTAIGRAAGIRVGRIPKFRVTIASLREVSTQRVFQSVLGRCDLAWDGGDYPR